MKLRLRDFETFPVHVCLEAQPGQLRIDYEGVCEVKRVVADLDIQKSGDEYFVQADICADAVVECARCLTPFSTELRQRMDFIITSESAYREIQAEATDDEDYVFIEGEGLEADLSDIVRQAVILALPMVPVCSEDCKGLCPHCKTNLNEKQCDCRTDDIDERWAALKDLPRE